jgi:Flp pilus assembly protein TadD
VLARIAPHVVLIERLDGQGRHWGSACAFIDSLGRVVTNRHCIVGAAAVKLNLGAAGMFDLQRLCVESEDLDVVALEGDFPRPEGPPLEWNAAHPQPHVPVSILVRSPSGTLRESPGRAGEIVFGHYSELALTTSAPAWLGCSGSPLLDTAGKVVAVVNKLGGPRPAQRKATAGASLAADVLALPRVQIPLRSWADGGIDPNRTHFEEHKQRATEFYSRDPERALSCANTARRIRPSDLNPVRMASGLLDRMGRADEAEGVLRAFAKAHPQDWRPWYLLGHRAYTMRNFAHAITCYEKSLRICPQAATCFWLGSAQWSRQDFPAAIRSFEESIRLEPRPQVTWEYLSRLYALSNQADGLLRVARRRAEMNPSDPDTLATLAGAQLRAGRQAEHEATLASLRVASPHLANRAALPPREGTESGIGDSATAPR